MANPRERDGSARIWAILAVGLGLVVWLVWPSSEPPPLPVPEPEPEPEVVVQMPRPKATPAPAGRPGGNVVKAGDEEALEESRTQVRLYRDAQVKALYDNSVLRGVQINGVSEGSFWDRLGVRDGDVVLEVNGELVDNPEASILLMNSLSRSQILSLRVRDLEGDIRYLEYRTPQR